MRLPRPASPRSPQPRIRLAPGLIAAMLCVASASGFAQRVDSDAERELPDWSGVWQMLGPTVFDSATVEPSDGRAGNPGVIRRLDHPAARR